MPGPFDLVVADDDPTQSAAARPAAGAPEDLGGVGVNAPGVSPATLRKVEHAAAALATRSVAMMDERLPWFRTLAPQQRSWVTLVAQAGIAGYVGWATGPLTDRQITDQVFGTAPRDLIRAVSLRRTVGLVRIAITVAEEGLPALAADEAEQTALRDSLLRYSREIAFAAAAVYAAAAETRGAWDARVEAALVDGIVRGEDLTSLSARAASLNWDANGETVVVVGRAPDGDPTEAVAAVAEWAALRRRPAIAGVQGNRLVVVLARPELPGEEVAELFGGGPLVRGPAGSGLLGACFSASEALTGLQVADAWPNAPRPVDADDLLPERVLAGDHGAAERLRRTVFAPLTASSTPLLPTIDAFLAHGGSLEPAARALFVHANTMRYRLQRIADLTGRDPRTPRDLLALQTALILGRLDRGGRSTFQRTPAPGEKTGTAQGDLPAAFSGRPLEDPSSQPDPFLQARTPGFADS